MSNKVKLMDLAVDITLKNLYSIEEKVTFELRQIIFGLIVLASSWFHTKSMIHTFLV